MKGHELIECRYIYLGLVIQRSAKEYVKYGRQLFQLEFKLGFLNDILLTRARYILESNHIVNE